MSRIYRFLQNIWGRFRSLRRSYQIGSVVAVLVIVAALVHFAGGKAVVTETQAAGMPHVQVASVSELASSAGPLNVVGTIKSKSQATILAQTSGEIVSLSRSIGDRVGAGSVLGQFENSSQRAAVTQAQGAYDSAAAALAKVSGTTAQNTALGSTQAANALTNAESSARAALSSAAAALDDAIHTKADALFTNPSSITPKLLPFTVPDSQLIVNVQNERAALNDVLDNASVLAASGGGPDTDAALLQMISHVKKTQPLIENLIRALNIAIPNMEEPAASIAAAQAALGVARTSTNGAVSSLLAAKAAYDSAATGAQTASNSADTGTASDIASARAGLKSAQGSLDAARANLEKTIIRSPITGTIVSLPVSQGDFVSNFAQVAIVSNPGAIYVEAQVTTDDAKTLAVGNPATIGTVASGAITFVAPALDPATGKIEVKIGLTEGADGLTDGETVSLSLGRTKTAQTTPKKGTSTTIPIAAVKMTPQGAVVFSVSASSTLESHPITLGAIIGDRVSISGIPSDTVIVTDARGRAEAEAVIVATSTTAF